MMNWTLSRIAGAVGGQLLGTDMAVTGVSHVEPLRFQRLGRAPAGEITAGHITMARLEIARLDNDPNAPENGRLAFEVHAMGGQP